MLEKPLGPGRVVPGASPGARRSVHAQAVGVMAARARHPAWPRYLAQPQGIEEELSISLNPRLVHQAGPETR